MRKIKLYSILSIFAVLFSACESDYLDTVPSATVSTATVFENTNNAKMALNGIARLMVSQHLSTQIMCGEGTIKFLFGEYTGENFSRPAQASGWYTVMNGEFHENSASIYSYFPWYYYYMLLGNVNVFLANIDNVEGPASEKQFLKAQALTYRAYCYTQLVQFYCYRWDDSNNGTSLTQLMDGLVLRTEEHLEDIDIPLSSSGEVYKLIYSDLDEAISLYETSGLSRSKVWEPNINVAHAVYARAAITRQDYSKAAEMAPKARQGYALMSNADYTSGFSSENSEWIWGSYGAPDQTLFFYGFHSYMAYDAGSSTVRTNPVCISKRLYDKIPATDIRKEMFLDPGDDEYSISNGVVSSALATEVRTKYPTMTAAHNVAAYTSFKFSIGGSVGIGYINHFRSAEMILIEAEAKYFNNDEAGAQALLNELIRDSKRDEAYACTATGTALLDEIKTYRSIELWGEGFDWLDKKRYNEPITRISLADGDSFGSAAAVNRPVDFGNRWTYVTPLIERENNKAWN